MENRLRQRLEDRGWVKARRNPASGAVPISTVKGDVCASYINGMAIRIDHKSTRGRHSISIQRSDLRKIREQAMAVNEFGFVSFNFFNEGDIYAVVPLPVLLDFLESATPQRAIELRNL